MYTYDSGPKYLFYHILRTNQLYLTYCVYPKLHISCSIPFALHRSVKLLKALPNTTESIEPATAVSSVCAGISGRTTNEDKQHEFISLNIYFLEYTPSHSTSNNNFTMIQFLRPLQKFLLITLAYR